MQREEVGVSDLGRGGLSSKNLECGEGEEDGVSAKKAEADRDEWGMARAERATPKRKEQ